MRVPVRPRCHTNASQSSSSSVKVLGSDRVRKRERVKNVGEREMKPKLVYPVIINVVELSSERGAATLKMAGL